MNKNFGLLGKKLGNTQVFNENGSVTRVTVVQVGPCTVVGKRTLEKDGYSAVILGIGEKREKLVTKPEAGRFVKLNIKPLRTVREFRVDESELAKFELGQVLKPSDYFTVGQKVDVTGKSKGRGFTGVMFRWNFKGSKNATHGTHEYQRHGGSIGTNMTPGRTLPNQKMPGQYGNEQVTIQNLKVAQILDDENLLLIEGAVPGSRERIVEVRGAVKTRLRRAAA
jgi:large subunit ribosomal protein L3